MQPLALAVVYIRVGVASDVFMRTYLDPFLRSFLRVACTLDLLRSVTDRVFCIDDGMTFN